MNKILKKTSDSLISPALLRTKLSDSGFVKKYRLLDVSLNTDELADYKKGHIEKAIYFDVGYGTKPTERYPKPFPPIEQFQTYLGGLGISNKHHLIIYDRSPYGFLLAPRAWWVMRVLGHEDMSILNGGFNGWIKSGFGLTDKIDHFEEENYQAKENLSLACNYEDIIENIKTKKYQVIDGRPKSHFNSINPVLGLPNNIPNSINVQHNEIFDRSTHCLKSNEDLKK
ncbi:3-mercaptopyruvate sulfurtransferase-like, partial [Brachionus plicatilis]